MIVQDLFNILKNTTFRSYFVNNAKNNRIHSSSQKIQEFSLSKFGTWQYGISNQGKKRNVLYL